MKTVSDLLREGIIKEALECKPGKFDVKVLKTMLEIAKSTPIKPVEIHGRRYYIAGP
jgi:hypothetical protein